jgi:hypothetical protein
MKTRLIDNAVDYPIVRPWWEKHQGVAVPINILPPVGVMVEDEDGHPLAAAWLYMAVGVGVAWMSWSVTNPAMLPQKRVKALEVVTDALEVLCCTHDYGIMFTETDKPALTRWFKARGFVQNHAGVTQLFKRV